MLERFFSYNSEKITHRLWLYFFAVIFVNIFFKIIHLGYASFWFDEIVSVESAWLDFGHIKHVSEWDNNPPFYYYCLSVWIKLFNDSEFCVRLLSVLFSAFSGGVLFLLANKYINKVAAIVVSFLYLSSNFLYFYSHEARAYSLMGLLVLVSSYIYLNFKEQHTWKHVFMLGLTNFLIAYTHYIGGIVIVFQILIMLFFFDKNQKIKFSSSILVTIMLIFLRFTKKQLLLIFGFNSPGNTFWLKKSDFSYLQEVLSEFFFNSSMIIPLLLIIVLGLILAFRFRSKQLNFVLAYSLIVGLGSIITIYVIGIKISIFLDRYLIFAVPFIYLLIAYVFSLIKYRSIGLVFSVVFFIYSAGKIDYKTPKPMDYRSAVNFIKHIKAKDDLIVVKPTAVPSLFCYYYEEDYLKFHKSELTNEPNILILKSSTPFNVNFHKYKRIIVVDAFEDLSSIGGLENNLLGQKNNLGTVTMFKGVKITFYQ